MLEDSGGNRAVLVTMDLVGINRELSREVCRRIEEQYKLPRAAIALCTSHTHSGPVVRGNLVPMFAAQSRADRRVKEYEVEVAGQTRRRRRRGDRIACACHDYRRPSAPRRSPSIAATTRKARCRNVEQNNTLVGPVDHDVPGA